MKTFAKVWVWLSVILPGLFGIAAFAGAAQMVQTVGPIGLAHQMGIRQLVYAAVTLLAFRKWGARATGWVIVGRGATDLGDGVDGLAFSTFSPMLVFPLVMAAISFGVAAYLFKQAPAAAAPVTVPR